MSLLRCALCNVLAPLVDHLCHKCIDVVEAYLDSQYGSDATGTSAASCLHTPIDVSDVDFVDDEFDSTDEELDVEEPIVDHVPDASALEDKAN